jgi:predicted aldo/keto reductase-like oxidoreductase
MFPYNIVETQAEALIAKCAEKNIGFVCMKPLAGGAIENAALAMRFIGANPNVSVIIPGMADVSEVDQNIAAANDDSPLTAEELAAMQKIRDELGTNFCRRCNYCQPCTAGINISGSFLFEGYYNRYGLQDWAKGRYMAMAKTASDCVDCGLCEERCPYHLPIRQMLKKVATVFGK